jgi:hypothetical protein
MIDDNLSARNIFTLTLTLTLTFCVIFQFLTMFNTIVGAGAFGVGAGAALRYGFGSYQMMRLLAAPALQHCLKAILAKIIIQKMRFDASCYIEKLNAEIGRGIVQNTAQVQSNSTFPIRG